MELWDKKASAFSENVSDTELFQTFEDPFDSFHPLEPKPFMPYHVSSTTLGLLPREIRDIIYTDLVVAGELSILRTSKAVCQEMTQLLFKYGTCHVVLDMNRSKTEKEFTLTEVQASAIQDLHIRLFLVGDLDPDPHLVRMFSDPSVTRQNCDITVEFCNQSPPWSNVQPDPPVRPKILDLFRALANFKTLTVRTRYLDSKHHLKVLQTFSDSLQVSLGRVSWHGKAKADCEAQYLEFHPFDYRKLFRERVTSRNWDGLLKVRG